MRIFNECRNEALESVNEAISILKAFDYFERDTAVVAEAFKAIQVVENNYELFCIKKLIVLQKINLIAKIAFITGFVVCFNMRSESLFVFNLFVAIIVDALIALSIRDATEDSKLMFNWVMDKQRTMHGYYVRAHAAMIIASMVLYGALGIAITLI